MGNENTYAGQAEENLNPEKGIGNIDPYGSDNELYLRLSREGLILDLSVKLKGLLGYNSEKISGKQFVDLVSETRCWDLDEPIERWIFQPEIIKEAGIRHSNGSCMWFALHAHLQHEDNQDIQLIFHPFEGESPTDMEERKKAFEQIVSLHTDPIAIISHQKELIYANLALGRILDFPKINFIGRHASWLFHPQDKSKLESAFLKLSETESGLVQFQGNLINDGAQTKFCELTIADQQILRNIPLYTLYLGKCIANSKKLNGC
jgi:PAS domain S-box-containing protein